jgi:DNA-binding XRE family transcriptional regulator
MRQLHIERAPGALDVARSDRLAPGLRVVRYRAEHEMSQSAFGRLVGMRQPHVARLEPGDHEPSLPTLARLSAALGIDFTLTVTPERGRATRERATATSAGALSGTAHPRPGSWSCRESVVAGPRGHGRASGAT